MEMIENLKQLERQMNNLVITHSPSIATDNVLSGEMEKYYFDYPAECKLDNDKLVVKETGSNESICFEVLNIIEISPISHNDKIVFPQKYVCALLYKDEQVVTFYFD